jgi:integrase
MAKRRGNGEGSIYQRKDGRWTGSISLEGGQRKSFYGKTRKEVQEQMKVALHQQQQGILLTGPQQKIGAYLDYWLAIHKPTIRPRSHERYEEIVRLHLAPAFENIPLQKLTPKHINMLYAQKLEAGLSPTTVSAIHNLLHKALDDAVRSGDLMRNVCEAVSPPRKVHKEIKPLSPEQVRQLLDAAHEHPQEALFILALATGMRRGELLGLKWQDINFTEGTLQVRRVLSRTPTRMAEEKGQHYMEAEPKTAKSRRNILLPPFAIEALKQHHIRQLEARRKAGDTWQDHDYVFCSPVGRHLNPGHDVLVQLKILLQKAELPDIRFHDLRHSVATMLLSTGVHPKIVQEILGHSQISMTMDTYSHVLPTMQKDAMSKLNNVLQG